MHITRSFSVLILLLALLTALPSLAAISEQAPRPALPQPSQQLEPEDVVRIVIEALARNDEPFPDAGIATTFAFASPANKVNTGPLEKFTQMVRNPTYGIMVDHAEHEFSEVVRTGSRAYQMVRIVGAGGVEVVFAFRLSLQQGGEFEGMWMTDAVWPVAGGEIREPAF
jgi:hypothetical protein